MLNIHFKKLDEQNIKKYMSRNYYFPGKMSSVKHSKLPFILHPVIFMWCVIPAVMTVSRFNGITVTAGSDMLIPACTAAAGCFLCIYLHEIIHALFYPLVAEKIIFSDIRSCRWFTFCSAELSRFRQILMFLAPGLILGWIPFCAWFIAGGDICSISTLVIPAVLWLNILGAAGDFLNALNVMRFSC